MFRYNKQYKICSYLFIHIAISIRLEGQRGNLELLWFPVFVLGLICNTSRSPCSCPCLEKFHLPTYIDHHLAHIMCVPQASIHSWAIKWRLVQALSEKYSKRYEDITLKGWNENTLGFYSVFPQIFRMLKRQVTSGFEIYWLESLWGNW